jgi:hypothetical protein
MPRLLTEWSTDDPTIAEALQLIASEPEHSSARMELEAALHTFQARLCWQRAERYREREREQEARDRRRAERQAAQDG